MTRYYLSGAISGARKANNLLLFEAAASTLRDLGYTIDSPAELIADDDTTWEQYMGACLPMLRGCGGIIMLPNWLISPGAVWEHDIVTRMMHKPAYSYRRALVAAGHTKAAA